MMLGVPDGPKDGRWRRVAALLVLAGGFADASIAHPDRLATVDLVLFASGIGSAVLFLATGVVTRPRMGVLAIAALLSILAVAADATMGLTRAEIAIAVADVATRTGLLVVLGILAARHLRKA